MSTPATQIATGVGLAISNTTANAISIPGNSYISPVTGVISPGTFDPNVDISTVGPNTISTTTTEQIPDLTKTPLGRNAIKQLVGLSAKLEKFFEYEFYIHPKISAYSYQMGFQCELRRTEFSAGNNQHMNPPIWTQPLLADAKGDAEDNLKISEVLQATAAMIWAVKCFREVPDVDMYAPPPEPILPNQHARKFVMACAKGFVLDDHEVPEEALGKLALITI